MDAQTTTNTTFDARSGQGPASVIPDEIKRWSWGAFLLTFIWGIGNRVWMSLLVFVPVVNVAAPFILGIKGNEMAWRAKQWPSVDAFQQTQKKWAIAGLIVLGVSVLLTVGSIVLVLMFGEPVTPNSDVSAIEQEQIFDSEFSDELEEASPAEWVTYSSPESDFSVDFPGFPEPVYGSYVDEDGESVSTTIYVVDDGSTAYLVAVEEFSVPPPTAPESEAIAYLRKTLDHALLSFDEAELISTEPTSFSGTPALRYMIRVGSERIEEGMLVMQGNRVYTVAAEYDVTQRPEGFDGFQSSFNLTTLNLN